MVGVVKVNKTKQFHKSWSWTSTSAAPLCLTTTNIFRSSSSLFTITMFFLNDFRAKTVLRHYQMLCMYLGSISIKQMTLSGSVLGLHMIERSNELNVYFWTAELE